MNKGKSNLNKRFIIYSDIDLDFKYGKIFKDELITFKKQKAHIFIKNQILNFIFRVIFREKKNITSECIEVFHFRYLMWRGWLLTLPIHYFILFICKINKIKVIWSCHNIKEHNFKSEFMNKILLNQTYRKSDATIVFHKRMLDFLPNYKSKVYTASFGEYKSFFENKHQNLDFQNIFSNWEFKDSINLLYISTSKKNKLKYTLSFIQNNLNCLIITPGLDVKSSFENILIYSNGKVYFETKSLLENANNMKTCGLIAHDNYSVPTSIYMFASFKIPMLIYQSEPSLSMVKEYGLGEIYFDRDSFYTGYKKLVSNYELYASACEKFLKINNWDNAQIIHQEMLNNLV